MVFFISTPKCEGYNLKSSVYNIRIMSTFRISVAIWSLGKTITIDDLERQLSIAREIGAKGVQLWAVDYNSSESCLLDPDRCDAKCRKEVLELLNSLDLEISGFCAQLSGTKGLGGLDEPEGLKERVEKTKRVLEFASLMGSPIVTTHPGRIPENKEDKTYNIIKKSISEISRYAEDVGAYFAVETGMEPPRILKAFIEDVGIDALRVNYDPANLLRYGVEEAVNGVRELGKWIVHTHAKDHNPKTGRATVGEGLVPWRRYLKELRDQGYSGWLALEDETGIDVVNSLKKGREFLLSLIRQL